MLPPGINNNQRFGRKVEVCNCHLDSKPLLKMSTQREPAVSSNRVLWGNTVDPWITQVLTVWVHFNADFKKYYSTTKLAVGWIVDVEPLTQRANCKVTFGFSISWGVGAPTPALFKGQLFF